MFRKVGFCCGQPPDFRKLLWIYFIFHYPRSMFRKDLLSQKRIVITGGATGLGFAIASKCAALGARVAILGRTQATLDQAKKDIESSHALSIETFVCDVRRSDDVENVAASIMQVWGGVDQLVNNAAGNFLCASEDLSPNAFKSVVDIVLSGTFHCTQSFGKQMIAQKSGNIVNIVTTYADSGASFVLPSACAKAGVLAMTRTLAVEWATYGIRLNAIAPGFFPTEGAWSRLVPPQMKFEERLLSRIPAKRLGSVDEMATLACFLLADESAYMTGQVLTMDGGESLVDSMFQEIANSDRAQLKKAFLALRPKK